MYVYVLLISIHVSKSKLKGIFQHFYAKLATEDIICKENHMFLVILYETQQYHQLKLKSNEIPDYFRKKDDNIIN